MLKKFTLYYLLLFIPTFIFSQTWKKLTIPTLPANYAIFNIDIIDENYAWALCNDYAFATVGKSPVVLRTTDGGKTWKRINVTNAGGRISFTIEALDSLTAILSTNQFLTADTRPIFKTIDGGKTWKSITPPDRAGGNIVHFFDSKNGLAINGTSAAFSVDGGETWTKTPLTLKSNEFLGTIGSFANQYSEVNGNFIVGTSLGRILISSDKGKSYSISQAAKINELITKIVFIDDVTGYFLVAYNSSGVLLPRPFIHQTKDGGKTWKVLPELPFVFTTLASNKQAGKIYIGTELQANIVRCSDDITNSNNIEICFEDLVSIHDVKFKNNIGYLAGRDENNRNILYKFTDKSTKTDDVQSKISLAYPNPTTGIVYSEQFKNADKISLYNQDGKLLNIFTNVTDHIDISNFENGMYILKIASNDSLSTIRIFHL